jgi:adenine phosphoribosyltransferase
MAEDRFYELTIDGCRRLLPIVQVAPNTRIAFIDIVGDIELMDAALKALLRKVPSEFEVIFGGDTVGLVVAHHLALMSGKPYVVARKKRTPVMTEPLTAEAQSVAAGKPATFWLGHDHAQRLAGKHVLVVDEVASTGATLRALNSLATASGARVVTQAVIATEGTPRTDVFSVTHLPVWIDNGPGR